MSRLTCLTCKVGFTEDDVHRVHFKSDWHRYNLKRKVADLPSVTAEVFEARRNEHEAKAKIASGEVKEPGSYCVACRKKIGNAKAYENHINSKKHHEMILKFEVTKTTTEKNSKKEESDMEVEEVDSDEWEEFDEDGIPVTDCVFCSHHSANMDNNIKHMTEVHSFFIPDPEYLVNTKGLLEYIGAKVGQGHMCLWCNERGKQFSSLDAVQKHMKDTGHCKILHEGDSLVEFSDFYDYSSSYPEGEDDGDSEVTLDSLDNTGYQLVLPSGATVGHRSLLRYYKQSVSNRQLVVADKGASNRLVCTYRAMGWVGTQEAARKGRDIKFINRVLAKSHMKLGCKANKLQKHFREQNPI